MLVTLFVSCPTSENCSNSLRHVLHACSPLLRALVWCNSKATALLCTRFTAQQLHRLLPARSSRAFCFQINCRDASPDHHRDRTTYRWEMLGQKGGVILCLFVIANCHKKCLSQTRASAPDWSLYVPLHPAPPHASSKDYRAAQ